MKMPAVQVSATAILAVAGILAAAVVGVWAWRRFDLGVKLNPADPNNIASQAVESVVTRLAGREESAGTAAYELTSSAGSAWRWLTGGTSVDDIDYSGPVTERERELVKRQVVNVNPRDAR